MAKERKNSPELLMSEWSVELFEPPDQPRAQPHIKAYSTPDGVPSNPIPRLYPVTRNVSLTGRSMYSTHVPFLVLMLLLSESNPQISIIITAGLFLNKKGDKIPMCLGDPRADITPLAVLDSYAWSSTSRCSRCNETHPARSQRLARRTNRVMRHPTSEYLLPRTSLSLPFLRRFTA